MLWYTAVEPELASMHFLSFYIRGRPGLVLSFFQNWGEKDDDLVSEVIYSIFMNNLEKIGVR